MASKRLQDIAEQLAAIHNEQVRQGVILERHEQRSTQLEARMEPVEKHVAAWGGVGKALTVLTSLAAIALAAVKALG